MARWLVALGLLLVAPAAASAREPVISYVDANGVFRLYDEETEAEVEPPPPVPANFLGFRYGISQDGRYVLFNDAAKKLHLLDRATNSQLPLPGIDVYTNPGGLTVSNTGLIGFDDNSNGPAVVYDSGQGQFVDTGLGANNGHRQTRLSADGRFLATTCVTNCVVDLGSDANPYVQDLGTKLDTAFPDDNGADEEHPCIDGDGSVVGFDKRRSATVMQRDIFLFDRSVSPPQAIDISGANVATENEVNCVLDAAAEYVGFYNNDTSVFRAFNIAAQAFLMLPPDKFDSRSLFSAPYTPPVVTPPGDTTKPVVRRFRMTHRRFRPHRRATRFKFGLSEAANVRITIRRRGARQVRVLVRKGRRSAGANTIAFSGRIRGRALRPGRYVAVLTATDAAGNRSRKRAVRFTVLRAAGDRRH
ncbi:MAG: hypothetical protein QOE69_2991 [Thermoleophilaceae bacterium]|jgi:hypothetical protein|nr:hypothetical protein [Thermoleophilaceae bacterium]